MKQRKNLILIITGIFIILIILIGLTYAYFLTRIIGNENDKSISITTANLELVYGDGNGILTTSKPLEPGEQVNFLDINGNVVNNKTFTVTNNGNRKIDEYVVVLENIINNIYLREDLTYTLKCVSVNKFTEEVKGACSGVSDVPFPRNDEIMVTNSIDVDIKHKYTLTLNYKETKENQSIDMGKTISAKINIYDRKDKYPLLIENSMVLDFVNNISTLENHAINYLKERNIEPSTSGNSTYFKGQSKWLVFNSIAQLVYNTDDWDIVIGNLDTNFTETYLPQNNFDINKFINMKYTTNNNGETSGVTHYSAALVAKMYNTDGLFNLVMDEVDYDNLAGWAGDLQTLIKNNLISKITDPSDYEHVYNTMSSLIGKTGTYFDSDDLYADIDAYNLYYLLTTTNSIKDVMTDYFTTKYKNRFNLFIKNNAGSLNYDNFSNNVYKYTKYSNLWPLYKGVNTTKFTSTVEQASRDAFTDFIWYLANFKELNIFSHDIEFEKGKDYEFIAEYININNTVDKTIKNEDYTWTVTKIDGTNCLSTISNGNLTIPSNETSNELVIKIILNKSNKITSTRIIKIS